VCKSWCNRNKKKCEKILASRSIVYCGSEKNGFLKNPKCKPLVLKKWTENEYEREYSVPIWPVQIGHRVMANPYPTTNMNVKLNNFQQPREYALNECFNSNSDLTKDPTITTNCVDFCNTPSDDGEYACEEKLSSFCRKDENLMTPVCQKYCDRNKKDCEEIRTNYAKRVSKGLTLRNFEEKKSLSKNLACFMPPEWYTKHIFNFGDKTPPGVSKVKANNLTSIEYGLGAKGNCVFKNCTDVMSDVYDNERKPLCNINIDICQQNLDVKKMKATNNALVELTQKCEINNNTFENKDNGRQKKISKTSSLVKNEKRSKDSYREKSGGNKKKTIVIAISGFAVTMFFLFLIYKFRQ
jgi:hypothetical protein